MPSLIVLAAIGLAFGLIEAGSLVSSETLAEWPRLFGAGAEGSRSMLEAIAGSAITVAGVAFSITVVALTLASSQYSPRILRNFMRDRSNQVVLGVLVGIFTYCLITLRTIRGGDDDFVPSLAVLGGFILALVGVGVLIYFIHHISSIIQAATIIASIHEETIEAIDHLFPEELGHEEDEEESEEIERRLAPLTWRPVPAANTGYIQNVDNEALLRSAREFRTVTRMERGIGEFVIEGAPLVSLAIALGSGVEPNREAVERLNKAYIIDRYRTVEQDAGFGIRQIEDIALKALSPGINDTTTAVMCMDYLNAILARLARRRIPSHYRFDDVYVTELAPSSVNFAVYFWAESDQANVLKVSDAVVTAVKLALDGAGIDIPYPHRVVLFHDVTGTRKGDIEQSAYLRQGDGAERKATPRSG